MGDTGKKPAVKLEFGERRVLFCEGSHGESEMLKDESCWFCWALERNSNKKRWKKKKMQRDMVSKMKKCLFLRWKCLLHYMCGLGSVNEYEYRH